jgi:CO/xanthine dehydrogenase Mo-binding subunit
MPNRRRDAEPKDLPPAGAGETPILTLAPAINNTILQRKVRLRSLPMVPRGFPESNSCSDDRMRLSN